MSLSLTPIVLHNKSNFPTIGRVTQTQVYNTLYTGFQIDETKQFHIYYKIMTNEIIYNTYVILELSYSDNDIYENSDTIFVTTW